MSLPRITPSFVVAVLALVIASGGVGFAAGQITSAQIQDGTIGSADVRNNALTTNDIRNGTVGAPDVRKRSIPRDRLDQRCARGEVAAFGGCVRAKPYPRAQLEPATRSCNRKNGRLPTLFELDWIRRHPADFTFGDPTSGDTLYEFSSDNTTVDPSTPVAMYRDGYSLLDNASAQSFPYHCVTY